MAGLPGPEFPSIQSGPGSPYSFSVAPARPPVPHFTTTTQFSCLKPEASSDSVINPGPNHHTEAKKEHRETPTAPLSAEEDLQKIQENNNNNQSENESSSEEVSPPKNQGLIKARGTYFPLTAFPTSMPQGSVMRRDTTPPGAADKHAVQGGCFTFLDYELRMGKKKLEVKKNTDHFHLGLAAFLGNLRLRVYCVVALLQAVICFLLAADENSPPISMKSKIGVNFMVSVGRSVDCGDNALAKLLQASQEMVSLHISY